LKKETVKNIGRIGLGTMLVFTGISHLTFERAEFKAQVPNWIPLNTDATIVISGLAEMSLGLALILAPKKRRPIAGLLTAVFFIAIFPGNIAQYTDHRSAFGLDTDTKRFLRLFLQPVFVYWAWRCTKKEHT
jgi:uncharacterized membrane protein